jgi:hypothetical protein
MSGRGGIPNQPLSFFSVSLAHISQLKDKVFLCYEEKVSFYVDGVRERPIQFLNNKVFRKREVELFVPVFGN